MLKYNSPLGNVEIPSPQKQFKQSSSINRFAISGNICGRDLRIHKNGTITFSIAHSFAEKSGIGTLFTEIVIYPRNGNKQIHIPMDLIRKGRNVIVEGYRRPGTWTDRKGQIHSEIKYVGLMVKDNYYGE